MLRGFGRSLVRTQYGHGVAASSIGRSQLRCFSSVEHPFAQPTGVVLADEGEPLTAEVLPVTTEELTPVQEMEANGFFSSLTDVGVSYFDMLHVSFGMPYWAGIVGTTLAFRVLLSPLMVRSMRNMHVMQLVRPRMEKLQKELTRQGGYKNKEAVKQYQFQIKELQSKTGFSMMKSFTPMLVQVPIFILFYFSIRKMVGEVPGMETGGMLWFTDLTAVDPLLRLNLLSASSMFLSVEFGGETGGGRKQMPPAMKWVMRALPVIYVPFTMYFPQALHLYWLSSSITAVTISQTLKLPFMRKLLDLPDMSKDPNVKETVVPEKVFTSKKEALKEKEPKD